MEKTRTPKPKSNERIIPIEIEVSEDVTEKMTEEVSQGTETIDVEENRVFELPEKMVPAYNVPEKIIIVYDCAKDEVNTKFVLPNGSFAPPDMLKRSLKYFLFNKHLIDARHEFALVVLNENGVVWTKDFTNEPERILNALNDVATCESEDVIDFTKLFHMIRVKAPLPHTKENFSIPPCYTVRVVFIYGRSFTMPFCNGTDNEDVIESPYFTFDVLMTHEPISSNNNCSKIFDVLQNVDKKGFAYFLSVERSASELHIAMAKLLAHPLQRPCQRLAHYSINKDKI